MRVVVTHRLQARLVKTVNVSIPIAKWDRDKTVGFLLGSANHTLSKGSLSTGSPAGRVAYGSKSIPVPKRGRMVAAPGSMYSQATISPKRVRY